MADSPPQASQVSLKDQSMVPTPRTRRGIHAVSAKSSDMLHFQSPRDAQMPPPVLQARRDMSEVYASST